MIRENAHKFAVVIMILVGGLLLAGCTQEASQPLPAQDQPASESNSGANQSAPAKPPETENVREFKSGEIDPEVDAGALEVPPV